MKKTTIILIVMFMTIPAYAVDYFPDSDILDLRVVEIDHDEGLALVRDMDGNEADIYCGDRIGFDAWTVIEINVSYIIVHDGYTKTRMPLFRPEEIKPDMGPAPFLLK